MRHLALVLAVLALSAVAVWAQGKPRGIVMTDIGGDPDDQQSLVRFLLYACDLEVEGLCTGFGHGHRENTRPDLIREIVGAYGEVLPSLRRNNEAYPSEEALLALIKDGHNGDPDSVGEGMDSEASDWIVEVLGRDDPRPVWFVIWGGPRELAQALWRAEQDLTADELLGLKSKIRIHSIADQDGTAGWIKEHHPDVLYLYSSEMFRGIWRDGDQDLVSSDWLEANVRRDHGPLGMLYPATAAGKPGVKEGDTPSFLYVLPNGLSDPEQPGWGGWGGRFRPVGRGAEWVPSADGRDGRSDLMYTVHRWREAFQNEFEARMDWCVRPPEECNHTPTPVLQGDRSTGVLVLNVDPGATVRLNATGSSDPDGDALAFRWWIYEEAGTCWYSPEIEGSDRPSASVEVAEDCAGREIHLILEVTDDGDPPLTAYRRAVLRVNGDPVPAPPGHGPDPLYLSLPVTELGPPDAPGDWTFFRGVNLGGAQTTIDGNDWAGDDATWLDCAEKLVEARAVRLSPPTDDARAEMIRSFRWDREFRAALTDVADGRYAVYAYLWEDNNAETFDVSVNLEVVAAGYWSGVAGEWRRAGPWIVDVTDGEIVLEASGGACNVSGIEVWRDG